MYNMAAVFFYKHIGYNLHILIGDNVVVFTQKKYHTEFSLVST